MSKKILFLLSLIFITSFSFAQKDSLHYNPKFLPNKTYTIEAQISRLFEMKMQGSKELMESLKKSGIKNPIIESFKSNEKKIIKTKTPQDSIYNFSIKVENLTTSQSQPQTSENYVLNGYCKDDGKPMPTSVSGKELNKIKKKEILDYYQNVFKEFIQINKKLKKGNSFDTTLSFQLPFDDKLSFDINIITHYTLNKIKGNYAYFSYESQFFNSPQSKKTENITSTIGGKGKGELVYDIKNNFTIKRNSNSNLIIKLNTLEAGYTINGTYSLKESVEENATIE